jgi:hypothetical protein
MCTESLPKEIADLPYGPERTDALHVFWKERDDLAVYLINQAFPETIGKPSDMGEVVMQVEEIAGKQ